MHAGRHPQGYARTPGVPSARLKGHRQHRSEIRCTTRGELVYGESNQTAHLPLEKSWTVEVMSYQSVSAGEHKKRSTDQLQPDEMQVAHRSGWERRDLGSSFVL
jgi:hypothetical protein